MAIQAFATTGDPSYLQTHEDLKRRKRQPFLNQMLEAEEQKRQFESDLAFRKRKAKKERQMKKRELNQKETADKLSLIPKVLEFAGNTDIGKKFTGMAVDKVTTGIKGMFSPSTPTPTPTGTPVSSLRFQPRSASGIGNVDSPRFGGMQTAGGSKLSVQPGEGGIFSGLGGAATAIGGAMHGPFGALGRATAGKKLGKYSGFLNLFGGGGGFNLGGMLSAGFSGLSGLLT